VIVTQNKFYSSMSMEKEPAGTFNKAQRLNERLQRIPHLPHLQGLAFCKAWPDLTPQRLGGTFFRLIQAARRLTQGELHVRSLHRWFCYLRRTPT
jgi:hypothetical protein